MESAQIHTHIVACKRNTINLHDKILNKLKIWYKKWAKFIFKAA